MIGLGSADAPAFDTREIPLELAAAGYEANGADTDYAATNWAGSGTMNRYRITAEKVFSVHAAAFNEREAQGPFDIRYFSRLPEYRPRGGVVAIIGGLTLREAKRRLANEPRDANGWAGLYYADTTRPVRFNIT